MVRIKITIFLQILQGIHYQTDKVNKTSSMFPNEENPSILNNFGITLFIN